MGDRAAMLMMFMTVASCFPSLLRTDELGLAIDAMPFNRVRRLPNNSSLQQFINLRVQYRVVLFYVCHSRHTSKALRDYAVVANDVQFDQLRYAMMDLTDDPNRALRSSFGMNSKPVMQVWKSRHQSPHVCGVSSDALRHCLAHLSDWKPDATPLLPLIYYLNSDAARHVSKLPSSTKIFMLFVRRGAPFPYHSRQVFASSGVLLDAVVLVSATQPRRLMEMLGADPDDLLNDYLVMVQSNSFEQWYVQKCDTADELSFKAAIGHLVHHKAVSSRFQGREKHSALLQHLYTSLEGFWSGRYTSLSPLRVLLYAPGVGIDDLVRSLIGVEDSRRILDYNVPVTPRDVLDWDWLPPYLPMLLKISNNKSHVFQGQLKRQDLIQFIS